MTAREAEQRIHEQAWIGRPPGLERTRELLGRLGDPHLGLKFVHITGTNGKGSTAAMVSSVLRRAGYRTGLYTSPHCGGSASGSRSTGSPSPTRTWGGSPSGCWRPPGTWPTRPPSSS